MGRRELRDIAVKCLFQYDFICRRGSGAENDCDPQNFERDSMIERLTDTIADSSISEEGAEYTENIKDEPEYESYFRSIVFGTIDNLETIDSLIAENSHGWTFDRISRLDLAVLRVAVYELLKRDDIPAVVAINEAIEISKKYGGEKSGTYINGVLGGIYSSFNG